MNVNVLLKDLIKKSNSSQAGVAEQMGFPSLQVFARRLLPQSTPKIDFVAKLLEAIGYKLVIVPQNEVRRLPENSIVIEPDFEFKEQPARSRVGKNS